MTNIGQSIYLLRIDKGLSQKDLASRAGVPQPNISAIEKGRDLKVSTLLKLAAALEVAPDDLIAGVKPLALDKRRFFERGRVEKFVNQLEFDHEDKRLNELARVLRISLSSRSRQKDLHLSWMKLRRTFSRDELDAIYSRLGKARERTGG